MTESEREDKLDEVRLKIADVIINLNLIEKEIKEIIANYISSRQSFFLQEILLNNHIINFSFKIKVLHYIIREEKITTSKDFHKALQIIMNKRNSLAHTDTVLEDYTIDTVEAEWEPDGVTYWPIYKDADPGVWTFSQGDINFQTVDKIVADFDKYYKLASTELASISQTIRIRHPRPKDK